MKSCKLIILYLLPCVIFYLTCSDLPVTPSDLNYKGYYSLEISLDEQADYYAFVHYKAAFSQGKDLYESFRVYSDPAGTIDSSIFYYNQTSDSFSLYFIKPFNGKIGISAKKPNGLSDTITFPISVKNLFKVTGDTSVLVSDTVYFNIKAEEEIDASENIRKVIWSADTAVSDTTYFNEKAGLVFKKGGSFQVTATCIDLWGNRLEVPAFTIIVYSRGPRIIDLTTDTVLKPGKPILIEIKAGSMQKDTATLFIAVDKDTLKESVFFGKDTIKNISITAPSIVDTGKIQIEAWITSVKGFSSEHLISQLHIATTGPVVQIDLEGDSLVTAKDNPEQITATGEAEKYVWTLGDHPETTTVALFNREEIETEKESILLTVFGIDSLGYRGPSDSLILIPMDYSYTLEFDAEPDSLIVKDTLEWAVKVYGLDGASYTASGVYSWLVMNEAGDTLIDTSSSKLSRFRTVLDDSTTIVLNLSFEDAAGNKAAPLSYSGILKLCRPGVSVRTPVEPIYSYSSFNTLCVMSGFRRIDTLYCDLLKGSSVINSRKYSAPDLDSQIINFALSDSGRHAVRVWVKDIAGIVSDTVSSNLYVLDGRPEVSFISVDPSILYWKQTITFSAIAGTQVPGKTLEKYQWSFDGDTIWDTVTATPNIQHIFSGDSAKVVLRVIDNEDVVSNIYRLKNMPVGRGEPIIEAVTIFDTAWIKDTLTVDISIKDPDDFVKYVFISWGDIEERIDTAAVNFSKGTIRVNHVYQNSGIFDLTVEIQDTNGLRSDIFTKKILVHEGRPVISVASTKFYYSGERAYQDTFQTALSNDGDTLFIPYLTPGTPAVISRIKALANDTNGIVKNYALKTIPPFDTTGLQWSESNEMWYNYSPATTLYPDSPAVKTVIYCKDDDGIIGADTLLIKTDHSFNLSTFNAPMIISPASWDTIKNATFELMWTGGKDIEDQMNTNVSITVYYNSGMYGYANNRTFKDTLGAFVQAASDTFKAVISLPEESINTGLNLIKSRIIVWDRVRQSSTIEQISNIKIQ